MVGKSSPRLSPYTGKGLSTTVGSQPGWWDSHDGARQEILPVALVSTEEACLKPSNTRPAQKQGRLSPKMEEGGPQGNPGLKRGRGVRLPSGKCSRRLSQAVSDGQCSRPIHVAGIAPDTWRQDGCSHDGMILKVVCAKWEHSPVRAAAENSPSERWHCPEAVNPCLEGPG